MTTPDHPESLHTMSQTITFPVALGDEVKDRITGFTGIVVALTEWFNRCQRATVQPPINKEGVVPPSEGFDVEQLDVVQTSRVPRKAIAQTGGPMPNVSEGRRL